MMAIKKVTSALLILLFVALISCEEESSDLTDDRDYFLGTWAVSENCNRDSYSVQIVKDPSNSVQVLINNFWNTGNCGNSPYAIVAGSSIHIPNQSFCDGAFQVSGSGDLDKETISWTYSINDGADLFTCTATFTLN